MSNTLHPLTLSSPHLGWKGAMKSQPMTNEMTNDEEFEPIEAGCLKLLDTFKVGSYALLLLSQNLEEFRRGLEGLQVEGDVSLSWLRTLL